MYVIVWLYEETCNHNIVYSRGPYSNYVFQRVGTKSWQQNMGGVSASGKRALDLTGYRARRQPEAFPTHGLINTDTLSVNAPSLETNVPGLQQAGRQGRTPANPLR